MILMTLITFLYATLLFYVSATAAELILPATVFMFALSNFLEGVWLKTTTTVTSRLDLKSFSKLPPYTFTTLALLTLTVTHTTMLWAITQPDTIINHTVVDLHRNNELLFGAPVALRYDVDPLAIKFITVTAWIGLASSVYTTFYMKGEPEYLRFLTLLHFFLFSILIFFQAKNILTGILGWELMGVYSYFLISFWKMKLNAVNAGSKAAVYNFISDASLIVFILTHYRELEHVEYPLVTQHYILDLTKLTETTYLLLFFPLAVAISCKSVAGLLHFWLPESMEAPVPASALIHSATLVSAGIYLTLRYRYALCSNHYTLTYLTLGACSSILLGSLGTISHYDLKKILAYSTISNCGLMLLFALYTTENICFLFFMFHGIHKAYAFFIVGFFFKKGGHKQDYRYFGNLAEKVMSQAGIIVIVFGSLGGTPLSFLYYVKHNAMVQLVGVPNMFLTYVIYASFALTTVTSLIYSSRIIYYILKSPNHFKTQHYNEYKLEVEYVYVIKLFIVYNLAMLYLLHHLPIADTTTLLLTQPRNLPIENKSTFLNTLTAVTSTLIIFSGVATNTKTGASILQYGLPLKVLLCYTTVMVFVHLMT